MVGGAARIGSPLDWALWMNPYIYGQFLQILTQHTFKSKAVKTGVVTFDFPQRATPGLFFYKMARVVALTNLEVWDQMDSSLKEAMAKGYVAELTLKKGEPGYQKIPNAKGQVYFQLLRGKDS